MQITFTARHFKPHADVKEHALDAIGKLDRFYNGILRASVILSYERSKKSVKMAEVNLHVYGEVLSAKEKTEDFVKSIDAVAEKLSVQLDKYKRKLRAKDKEKVRAIKQKV